MERGIAVVIILTLFSGGVTCLHAQEKSTALALGLSISTPLAMIGLGAAGATDAAIAGMVVAPSTGHFYAGQWRRGLLFSSIRGGFTLLTLWVEQFYWGAVVISVIDVIYVPQSVFEHNESLQTTGKLHLIPRIDPKNERYGISVVYRF